MADIKLGPENEIDTCGINAGYEYERKVTILTALSAALNFDNFEINTNVKSFKPLDDIVLTCSHKGEETIFCIQIKHVATPTSLQNEHFIKETKSSNKPKINLVNYNKKYGELCKDLDKEIKFIVYTAYNLDINKCKLFFDNEIQEDSFKRKLNTSAEGKTYHLDPKLTTFDKKFIKNSYFLFNQQNVDDIDNSIINLLIQLNLTEDLSYLIVGDLFYYIDNICSEISNKPLITKALFLKLLYFSCFHQRNISLSKLPDENNHNHVVYSPYLWDYLKRNKVIIKREYIGNIQNMIFNHEASINNSDPIVLKILFKHNKFGVRSAIKNYFVGCFCGVLPFLIETRYYKEVINILENFEEFQIIFFNDCSDKHVYSKFDNISLNICHELFKTNIQPKYRNKCLIGDLIKRENDIKYILKNMYISDFLEICDSLKLKNEQNSMELERLVYLPEVKNSLNEFIKYDDNVVILINCSYSKIDLIYKFNLIITEELIVSSQNDLKFRENAKIITLDHAEYNRHNINTIREVYRDKRVFILHNSGSRFYMINHFGGLENLKFASIYNTFFRLNDIHELLKFNELIIFSGVPGIGKSVAMDQLAHFISPEIFVLLIKLREKYEILSNLSDNIKCLDILEMLSNESNTFYLNLLKVQFQNKKLSVIFDGYDEIAPTFVEKTNALIKCIMKAGIQVILTTRTNLQTQVEEEFCKKSLTLKSFNLKEQAQYFEKYFLQNSELSENDIQNVCAIIIEKIKNNLICDENFNSVPLHLKIISELLLDLIKQNKFYTSDISINKIDIYQTFIEKKLNKFKKKTKNFFIDEEDINRYHQSFAKKEIFPNFIDSKTEEDLKIFSGKLKKGSESTGLLVNETNNIFIHRTIAEYLAAMWLINNFKNRDLCKQLISNEILKKEYQFINWCFNSLLYSKTSVYNKIISNNFDEIDSDEITREYSLNRNILHLIVLNLDTSKKSKFITSKMEKFLIKLFSIRRDLIYERDYFELTPINYSEKIIQFTELKFQIKIVENYLTFYCNKNFNLLELFICKDIKTNVSEIQFNNGVDLLLFTLDELNLNKYKFIFYMESFDRENNERLLDCYKSGLKWFKESGENINDLYYRVISINSLQLAKFLLEEYGNSKFWSDVNGNPLFYAFLNNLFEFIKLFLENDIIVKNNRETFTFIISRFIKRIIINNNENLINYFLQSDFNLKELKIYNHIKLNYPQLLNTYRSNLNNEINDKIGNTMIHLLILDKYNEENLGNNAYNIDLLKLLRYLVENHYNINTKNNIGKTALHLAIQKNDLETIKYLINSIENVNIENNLQNSILQYAVHENNLEITKFFLENGANINYTDDDFGNPPLIWAVKSKNLEMVRLLESFEADLNKCNNKKESPLHWAVIQNNLEVATFLIENGAHVEAFDIDQNTPLMWAVDYMNLEMVKLLLQFRANINMCNKESETPLHRAVSKKESEITQLLLNNRANIEAFDCGGDAPLIWAVQHKNLEMVRLLIQFQANVNTTNKKEESPLHWAVWKKELDITKYLYENEAILEAEDSNGNTPLMWAVWKENLETVKLLAGLGANINTFNKRQESPLHTAVSKNDLEIIKFLLKNQANVETLDNNGDTPLIWAVQNSNLETVKQLIKFGAKINTSNHKQESPLHWAVKKKETDVATLLLQNNADLEALDINNNNPLIWAVSNKNLKMVQLLINNGAQINKSNKKGQTSLHVAVSENEWEITNYLLFNKAEVEACDDVGDTPLVWAVQNENLKIIKLLIKFGARTNTGNKKHENPLHRAVSKQKIEIARILLENGASVETKDDYGDTPLSWAVKIENLDMLQLLIEFGAKTNSYNKKAETPLHFAVFNQKLDVAKCLLQNEACLESQDINKSTPLMWAVRNESFEMVELLLNYGADVNTVNKYHSSPLNVSTKFNNEPKITKILLEKGARGGRH